MTKGLAALLQSTSSITSLVNTAIYPVLRPEDSPLPCIVYRTVGRQSYPTFNTSGVRRIRIDFTCWGTTYATAETVRQALSDLLENYTGTLSDGSIVSSTLSLTGTEDFTHDSRSYTVTQEYYFFFV